MKQAIPSKLYAQGIYYVSSILGLGAKLKGHLEGEFYSEQFDTYRENIQILKRNTIRNCMSSISFKTNV